MRLPRPSRGSPAAIFLLVGILSAAGVLLATRLPAAIFPAVTFPIVKVITDAGEEPASRMMPAVTRPLEEAIHRVPGVRRVLSATSRGSSEISAEFAWGTEMQVALQRVAGRGGPDPPRPPRRRPDRRRVDEHGGLPHSRLRAHVRHAVRGRPPGSWPSTP